MSMYKICMTGGEFIIPKENLLGFAYYQALQRGMKIGYVHDDETAIKYLKSVDINVIREN